MNVRTEYFYGREADQFVFYRLPKLLVVREEVLREYVYTEK